MGLRTKASFQSPPQNHPLPLRFLCKGMVTSEDGSATPDWLKNKGHRGSAYEFKGVGGLLHELHLPIGSPGCRDLLIAKHRVPVAAVEAAIRGNAISILLKQLLRNKDHCLLSSE